MVHIFSSSSRLTIPLTLEGPIPSGFSTYCLSVCPTRWLLASELLFLPQNSFLNSIVSFYLQVPTSGKTSFQSVGHRIREAQTLLLVHLDVLLWEATVLLHCLFIQQPLYKLDQMHSPRKVV